MEFRTVQTMPDVLYPAMPVEPPAQPTFSGLLDQFAPTTLADLDKVALLNRVDTKYLLNLPRLTEALAALTHDYRVLEIGGVRQHRYRTVYFDTPAFDLFRQHHAGRAVRFKARSRAYLDSGLAFFEVKAKNNKGRTIKHRLTTTRLLPKLTAEASAFLAEHASTIGAGLEPKLTNSFTRITLVGIGRAERLTLDLDLRFEQGQQTAILPGLVIAELKQAGVDHGSPFIRCMRDLRVLPMSVSKYCVGVSLLYPEIRHNRFKPQLRAIRKLTGGYADVW